MLGALLADGIRQPQPGQFFYGTGESFLFSVSGAEDAGADTGTESEGTEEAPPDDIGKAGTTDVRVYQ